MRWNGGGIRRPEATQRDKQDCEGEGQMNCRGQQEGEGQGKGTDTGRLETGCPQERGGRFRGAETERAAARAQGRGEKVRRGVSPE